MLCAYRLGVYFQAAIYVHVWVYVYTTHLHNIMYVRIYHATVMRERESPTWSLWMWRCLQAMCTLDMRTLVE